MGKRERERETEKKTNQSTFHQQWSEDENPEIQVFLFPLLGVVVTVVDTETFVLSSIC